MNKQVKVVEAINFCA